MAECGGSITSTPHDEIAGEFARDISEIAQNNPMTMAVVGCGGQGKSKLVNSLLHFNPRDRRSAKEGGVGKPTTVRVKSHTNRIDGAAIKIVDTPGLDDTSHVNQEKVIQELHEKEGHNLNIVLFCIAYHRGVRVSDGHRNTIKLLTTYFGNEIWKKTRLVLTMVNTVSHSERHLIPELKCNMEHDLKLALRDAGVPQDVVDTQHLLLAGKSTDKLWINEEVEVDWNKQLFNKCLDTVKEKEKKITLIQGRHGKAFWLEMAMSILIGGTVGIIAGAKSGATYGAECGGVAGGVLGAIVGGVAVYGIDLALKHYQKKYN